jgi:hypothetical protein
MKNGAEHITNEYHRAKNFMGGAGGAGGAGR